MGTRSFTAEFRSKILEALPAGTSLYGSVPELRHTYLPAAHVKALRPESMLVVGMRGSGKSFWWAALQDEAHRELFGESAGLSKQTIVTTGFGERPNPDSYPNKDTLARLLAAHQDARRIWQTVVLKNLLDRNARTELSGLDKWDERVAWVRSHPEEVEQLLYDIDRQLVDDRRLHLVLFDALDRSADEWRAMNILVRGLLQVVLEFRSYRSIRLKVFIRPDQIDDPEVGSFPDSSKLFSERTVLNWPKTELFGLFWQHLANADSSGPEFREATAAYGIKEWTQLQRIWLVPQQLRTNEDLQRRLFHSITGPWMGRNPRRGFPYTWLPNHLGDAKRNVSPRSFLAALWYAANDDSRSSEDYPLHFESIKRGVQAASTIRVGEIKEDYAWIEVLLQALRGLTVPCLIEEIDRRWKEGGTLARLEEAIQSAEVRLPPAHLSAGPHGVVDDLVNLAILERLPDGRINLPDVYRIGYGIGRKGGVKPVV